MLLILICLVVILSFGKENDRVQAKHQSVLEGFDNILKVWFPEDAEFNESCVSESCPELNNFNLCPNDINVTVLHRLLKSAIGCLREPICGILIDNRPTIAVTSNTDDWLPGMGIDGTASHFSGGSLSNVSNIEFELLPDHNQTHQPPLQIAMFISNLRMRGSFQLELTFRSLLPSVLSQALPVTLPEANYDIDLNYFSSMSINYSLTHSNFHIKLLNPIIKGHPIFCGLDMPEGFPSILTMFYSRAGILIDKSSWGIKQSAILEKYFQSVFHIVSKNC